MINREVADANVPRDDMQAIERSIKHAPHHPNRKDAASEWRQAAEKVGRKHDDATN
jgi:hypothetical protein